MTTLFDDLLLIGKTLFDDLDHAVVSAYEQQGAAQVTFVPTFAQEHIAIYDQLFDVVLNFSSNAAQEYVTTAAPLAYLQSGNVLLVTYMNAAQEHIGIAAGEFGQTGNVTLVFHVDAGQSYSEGVLPGEVLQQATALLTLIPNFIQIHDPKAISDTDILSVGTVAPYAAPTPTVVTAHITPFLGSLSQVVISFASLDQQWLDGVGPRGGVLAVEVAMQDGNDWIPLASLSKDYPTAMFWYGPAFEYLRGALLDGVITFRLGGFEGTELYTTPRSVVGPNLMSVEGTT